MQIICKSQRQGRYSDGGVLQATCRSRLCESRQRALLTWLSHAEARRPGSYKLHGEKGMATVCHSGFHKHPARCGRAIKSTAVRRRRFRKRDVEDGKVIVRPKRCSNESCTTHNQRQRHSAVVHATCLVWSTSAERLAHMAVARNARALIWKRATRWPMASYILRMVWATCDTSVARMAHASGGLAISGCSESIMLRTVSCSSVLGVLCETFTQP